MKPAVVRTFVDPERAERLRLGIERRLAGLSVAEREAGLPITTLAEHFPVKSVASCYRLASEGAVKTMRLPSGRLCVSRYEIARALSEAEERGRDNG